ncbi:KLK13 [Lemmus lemmus]
MWPLVAAFVCLTVALSGGISRDYPKILNGTNGTNGFLPGGYTCLPHSQPWQAALLVHGRLLCGGVLVHPKWILTAAHCRKDSCTHSGYTVHLGKHALGRVENGEQAMEVVRSIPHPEYQVSPTHLNHDHDIMLLELKSPVQLSSHIRALPLSSDDCLPTGTCCRVSGWGTTTSPQGKCLHWLLEFAVTLLSRKQCEKECEHAYPGKITQNMVCAGDKKEGNDSCQGDSGGPLVCGGHLRGLVSWGNMPCGSKKKPGVYTDVCTYIRWIQNIIKNKRL